MPNHTHLLSFIHSFYVLYIHTYYKGGLLLPFPIAIQSNIPMYHMSLSHFNHRAVYFDFLFPNIFPSFNFLSHHPTHTKQIFHPNIASISIYNCIQQKFFILSLRLDDFFLHLFPAPSETQSNPIYQKKNRRFAGFRSVVTKYHELLLYSIVLSCLYSIHVV